MTLPDLLPFLLATAILAALILYSRQFRATEIGRAFLALMLCALVWVALFDLECVAPDPDTKLLFFKLEFLGIAFVPVTLVWRNLDGRRRR